jgi:carboxymethylenebutenolidase
MSNIRINAADGSGDFFAYVAKPETDQPAPAVIVIQEIFGVNKVMRDTCDSIAQTGYIAICPDLFWRQEPGIDITDQTQVEWDKAFELFNGFDVDKGVDDLIATLSAVREMDDCNGLVGDIGFCLGGKLAYLMAARSDVDCSVSYYGVGIQDMLDEAKNINNPLLMHIASEDKFVPKDAQEQIHKGLESNEYISRHVYEGCDHAFARRGGEHFDQDAASLANMRTSDFLATYLGSEA